MTIRADVIVLGAGMVGVSVALYLQQRDRDVVLADRRGPGEETSYGNSGLIQRGSGSISAKWTRRWRKPDSNIDPAKGSARQPYALNRDCAAFGSQVSTDARSSLR